MRRLLMRFGNTIVAGVLRSPLHRLMSGGVALITVTGRVSGRRYTTPVQYVRRDDDVYIVSRRGRSWWRNLRGGAEVGLRLRGRELTARAVILEGEAATEAAAVFEGSSLGRAARRPDAVVIRATVAG